MSCNYADGLSPYHDKGQLGLDEKFDNKAVISVKVDMLSKWISKAKHVVIHTGAGISTSAGIPDFRGPRGVWTLQAKGQKPDISTDFNEAVPTPTHMAIARLVDYGKAKYVVSQNIDGLHLRSGLPRKFLSELHGNMFVEQCNGCNRQFVRNSAVPTVGQKSLNKACPTIKPNGRACRGRLHDTILDWEHNLPENDLAMADFHSCLADLSIALGTTMQIVPSGSLPLYTKKAGGKLVIVNLQPTKHDTKADLLIHGYVDDVMLQLMKLLSIKIPKYSTRNDPTKIALSSDKYFEWTISDKATQEMRKIYEAKCGSKEARKRLEMIDDDDVPLMNRVKKRKSEALEEPVTPKGRSKKEAETSSDSDLEVIGEVAKKKRGRPSKTQLPVPTTKLTIKKNVTPTKTKYEIVPCKSERRTTKKNCEIVREKEDNVCTDLEMICESDDDGPNVFTTNFRRYLHDDKTFKREEKPDIDPSATTTDLQVPSTAGTSEIKVEEVKKEETTSEKVEERTLPTTTEPQVGERLEGKKVEKMNKSESNPEILSVKNATKSPIKKSTELGKSTRDGTEDVINEISRSERSAKGRTKSKVVNDKKTDRAQTSPITQETNSQESPQVPSVSETLQHNTEASKSSEPSEKSNILNSSDATDDNLGVLSSDVDLPPINDNLLYGSSELDLYGNY